MGQGTRNAESPLAYLPISALKEGRTMKEGASVKIQRKIHKRLYLEGKAHTSASDSIYPYQKDSMNCSSLI
jgi:hypothetical protein